MVLIVDDTPDVARAVALLLKLEGIDAMRVATAKAALEAIEQERPSVVILDHSMPDVNGLELLRQLRATADYAGLPVIMHSASSDPERVARAHALGADVWLVKSRYIPDDLLAAVRAKMRA